MVVLDHAVFAIEMMDKTHVQDLDMLLTYDQDDLSLSAFAAITKLLEQESEYRFIH
jgi:hypothetical protein